MQEYFNIINSIFRGIDEETLKYGIQFMKIVMVIISIIIAIIIIISMWKIFKKAGQSSWKCLIPIYNLIILYKISGMSPAFLLTIILFFIPQISLIAFIAWNIVDATQKALLTRKFNKSVWFIVGMILFDFIFYPILAFGKSKYKENIDNKTNDGHR